MDSSWGALPEVVVEAELGEDDTRFVDRSRPPCRVAWIEVPGTAQSPRLLEIEHTAPSESATREPAIDVLFRPEE